MDSFELNKIAGAVLFCLLILAGMHNLSGILVNAHKLEQPAFKIEVAEEGTAAGPAAAPEPSEPLPVLLAKADAAKGAASAKKCETCHTFAKGGANKIGPNLWNIVGRAKAEEPGFAYSAAVKGKGGAWSYDDLFNWIGNPKEMIPGNKMAFAGIKTASERAKILAYLQSQADSPKPFPAP